jgi:hypothetical protein
MQLPNYRNALSVEQPSGNRLKNRWRSHQLFAGLYRLDDWGWGKPERRESLLYPEKQIRNLGSSLDLS